MCILFQVTGECRLSDQGNLTLHNTEKGRTGATQHMSHSGIQENGDCMTQSNPYHFSLDTGIVLQRLPRATPNSRPKKNTARAIQRKLVCPARGQRTTLQVYCQRDLGYHPATGVTTQQIAYMGALGPYRELHIKGTVRALPPP